MSARNTYNVAPIPGDNNGGSGGGGGEPVVGGGLPVGSVIPFAGIFTPPKFFLCNGAELNLETYRQLFDSIQYNYGINPGIVYQPGITSYSTPTTSTINFSLTSSDNYFIVVGTILKLSNFTAITGPNINGLLVTVTAAPAINARGTISATFSTPLPATGDGGVGFLNRITFKLPDLRLASPVGVQAGTIALGTSGGSATTTITANNLPTHQHGMFQPGSRALSAGSGNLCGDFNVDANLRTIRGETYVEGSTESNGALVQNLPISVRNPYVGMNYIIKAET